MILGREPLQIVEVDVDHCTLTYGEGSCPAVLGTDSDRKCWNTYFTCPVQGSFNPGTLTLRFAKNQSGLPKGQTIFPALRSVSTNPTTIGLGGVEGRLGSLGKRARVDVQFKDFTYHDRYVDKYQSERISGAAQADGIGYDPERGTFFGKLRARFPYYYGRALRVKNGYVGDNIATMPTRHYIITEWIGPDASGNVKITAQDPLKLADEEFAQCPKPSNGKLADDIGQGLETFLINPPGIGGEYENEGYATIGSEVVRFTRSGRTITLTERGVDGTEAADHSEDDTFQQAFRVEEARPYDVARQLLRDFADVPNGFIPYADWQLELDRWLFSARLTRTVSKPTSVKKLLEQIADLGLIFWWDEIAQEVKLRANRPPEVNEVIASVSDAATVIEGSLATEDLNDQRLSQVWFYHGLLSATDSATDPDNYRRLFAAVDLDAESEDEYDQRRVKEIFMPWLGPDGNDATASSVASRLRNRYRDTPRQVTFTADIKDKDALDVARLIEMQTRVIQDPTGASDPTQMQVTRSEEASAGNRVRVTAILYQFRGRYGFITENNRSDYGASNAAQKATGAYLVDESTLEFSDGTSPYLLF